MPVVRSMCTTGFVFFEKEMEKTAKNGIFRTIEYQ